MSRFCTVPNIFGLRKWWTKRFNLECKAHDYLYETKSVPRIKADYIYAKTMWNRGYRLLSLPTFLILYSFGWIEWYNVLGDK